MNNGPANDLVTTLALTGLAALTMYVGTGAVVALMRRRDAGGQRAVLVTVAGVGLLLMIYRWTVLAQPVWPPSTHVDGLVLVCTALSALLASLQHPARVPGVAPFGMPVIALMLLWAICAGRWTYARFNAVSLVTGIHLTAIYVGAVFFCVAAAGGAGYLHRRSRIRRRQVAGADRTTAPLEALEQLIVRSAALAFALLTVAVLAGIISWANVEDDTAFRTKLEVKVGLAAAIWALYGMVISVRFNAAFRGARAAWMSILGVILLLAAFAVASATGGKKDSAQAADRAPPPPTPNAPEEVRP